MLRLPSVLNRRWAALAGTVLLFIWAWIAFDRLYVSESRGPLDTNSNYHPQPILLTTTIDDPRTASKDQPVSIPTSSSDRATSSSSTSIISPSAKVIPVVSSQSKNQSLHTPTTIISSVQTESRTPPLSTLSTTPTSTSTAVHDAFDFPAPTLQGVKKVCEATAWNPDVVFTCNESFGGVGNIRNSILSCVRYAIAAGAALVVPQILLRDETDISSIKSGHPADLSHMFDKQHFIDSLHLSCLSLRVYKSESDIPGHKSLETVRVQPEEIVKGDIPLTGIPHPEQWRETFYEWLKANRKNATTPTIVALQRTYLKFPIHSDGEPFAMEFGNILKFRPDVRKFATSALQTMAKIHHLSLDLSKAIMPGAFFGVHLRTEEDAVKAWSQVWKYGRYPTQSRHYLEQAPRSNTSLIYVASGDPKEVAKFTDDASKIDMNVTTKWDLLQKKEQDELKKLAWDQQALVDFLILLKGTDFAGIGHSSFAWNIALKRRVYAKKKETFQLADWNDGDELLVNGTVLLSDEYSRIYGIKRPEYEACLWP